MATPISVITGDVHFTLPTLEEATESVRRGLKKAEQLGVPFILNGDTLDSKDVLRARIVNRLIELISESPVTTYVNWGNHESTHEKADTHSLHFLKPYAKVIDTPTYVKELESYILPYYADPAALQVVLNGIPKGSRLIIHQGVQTAFMGSYTVDRSSLPKEAYADFRVIASHYHRAQDIKCGRLRKGAVGLFSYCGNPYSLNFSEAADGPKGFQVLYDDGLMEQIPTNLRKHVIESVDMEGLDILIHTGTHPKPDDLLWLKVSGTYQELESLNKHKIGMALLGHSNFKLEKIYTDAVKTEAETEKYTGEELMDKLIDNTAESANDKVALKALWRGLA